MDQVRGALLIAGNDLRRRVRNRSFVIRALVGPLVLATIISLAIGDEGSFDATIGVVDADGSDVSQRFVDGVAGADAGGLDFVVVDSAVEARERVDDGDLGAAVVVPAGFAASLATDEPGTLEVVASGDRAVSAEVARAVAAELADRTNAARLAVAASIDAGAAPPSGAELAEVSLPVAIDTSAAGDVSPAAFFGPAMGLVFLFISVGAVARDLLADRRVGRLDRLRAGPVASGTIVAGKGLAVVVTCVCSLLVIWAVTTIGLGADWGDPAAVLLLVVAASLTIGGIAGLVAAVARTDQSAETLASVFGFVLAILGGAFAPPGSLAEPLQRVALFTPLGWALRGFGDTAAADAGVSDVMPNVAVLVAWGIVAAVIAARVLPSRLGAR
jgi:ABC-2 type transport system permease protein